MNHRQWKKKFKKTHGRNPSCWEDKRKRIRYDAKVLVGAISEMPSLLARACANACEALRQGVATLSEHMKGVVDMRGDKLDEDK